MCDSVISSLRFRMHPHWRSFRTWWYKPAPCCRLLGDSGMSGHWRKKKKDCRGVPEVVHHPQEQHCNQKVGFRISLLSLKEKTCCCCPIFLLTLTLNESFNCILDSRLDLKVCSFWQLCSSIRRSWSLLSVIPMWSRLLQFQPELSQQGSNKRAQEEKAMTSCADYLLDCEG